MTLASKPLSEQSSRFKLILPKSTRLILERAHFTLYCRRSFLGWKVATFDTQYHKAIAFIDGQLVYVFLWSASVRLALLSHHFLDLALISVSFTPRCFQIKD